MKRFFAVIFTLFFALGSLCAKPSKISNSLFGNGNMEVFNGEAKFEGNIADGDYFAYVLWDASEVWGQKLPNAICRIVLLDMEHDLPDDHIYLGDADNNPLTPYLDKLSYRYAGGTYHYTALVKVVIKKSCITRIYADDSAWVRYVNTYGSFLTAV